MKLILIIIFINFSAIKTFDLFCILFIVVNKTRKTVIKILVLIKSLRKVIINNFKKKS